MKKLKFWGILIVIGAVLVRPEAAAAGAQRAMRLWASGVAPALFPFLALMPALTGSQACAAYNALFSRFMGPVFGLPGAAAPAVVIGMIAGSPGGALAVRRIASASGMTRAQAARISLALGGVSPAYLITVVGCGLYGSTALGVKLAAIQAAVQLALLMLLRGTCDDMKGNVRELPDHKRTDGIRSAVEGVLVICGYMVLFSSIAGVAADFLGEHIGAILLLAADMPSGLAALAEWDMPGKMLIQGAAIGFGGLCIAAQNLDAMGPVDPGFGRWIAARSISSALFAGICAVVLRSHPANGVISVGQTGKVYAFSMLAACAAVIPALFFLSKNLFLNKRDS